MRHALAILVLIGLGPCAFAQSQSFSSLEERMSAKDFRDAGLDQNIAALGRGYRETQIHHLDREVAA